MSEISTDALRHLVDEARAGLALVEPHRHEGNSEQYIYGALHTIWMNAAHLLLQDPEVEPWSIEPLVTGADTDDEVRWEYGPDRTLAMTEGGVDPVRPTR